MTQSEEILATLDTPIFRLDSEGVAVYANPACARFIGVTLDEIIGRSISDWCGALAAEEIFAPVNVDQVYALEPCETRPGVWVSWQIQVLTDAGKVTAIQGQGTDVSAKIRMARRADENIKQFRWMFKNAPVPLWLEDFSEAVEQLDQILASGVTDMESFLDSNPAVVDELLHKVKIIDVNDATVRSFGFEHKEEMLVNLHELFHENILHAFRQEMVAIAEGHETFMIESPAVLKNGELMETLLFMSIPERREMFKEVVIANIDITELKRTQKELEQAREIAEEASRAKSAFVSTMSHEIRTPLNGIIGFTNLLLEEKLSPSQNDFVNTIHACSETLLGLINQVLDMAQIESLQVNLTKDEFCFEELIGEIASTQKLTAKAKSVCLEVTMDDALPHSIVGDRLKINQIITNLARNAVKFCDEGEVRIACTRIGDDRIQVLVSDTGIGIGAEALANIFQPFRQEDSSHTRKFEGTGLGLTIAKSLAEVMDGRLWLESEKGVGTRCYFEFPLVAATPLPTRRASRLPVPQPQPGKGTLTVLTVDDNKVNLKLVTVVLKRAGFEVVTAANGREAVEVLAANPRIDAVLMDLQMPVLDGYEAARMIRAGEAGQAHSGIPIAALTANVLQDEESRVLQAGMDHFIAKPLKVPQLLGFVERFVRNRPATQSK